MKNLMKSAFALLVAAFAMTACSSDKIEFEKPNTPTQLEGTGYLCFSEEGLSVITDAEVVRAQAVNVDDFICQIYREKDEALTLVQEFTYGEKPADPIKLKVGNYQLVVKSQADAIADLEWEKPVYGATVPFTITADVTNTLEPIKCKLQNIKVTVGYSADLAEILQTGSKTEVSLLTAKAAFIDQDERAAYFGSKADENTLVIDMSLNYADKNAKMSTSISGVKAGQWRKLTINMPHANEGNVTFTITVETLTADEEVVVDIADVVAMTEEVIPDDGVVDPLAPTMTWGEYELPTADEPFKLLASHFDENGNCTLPALAVDANNSTITSFVVAVESTNSNYMALWEGMEEFDLCTVTGADARILSAYGIPTGNNVSGKASISMPISGLLSEIFTYSYTGTHIYTMTITNAAGHTLTETLAFSYSSGAAPTIEWVGYDIKQAYTITKTADDGSSVFDDSYTLNIAVTAESGIAGLTVDILSDVLDAETLQGVGLPTHLNLIDPVDPELGSYEDFLVECQFPVRDQVAGQPGVNFDITGFMGILVKLVNGAPAYANFEMTVTDNNGATTTETIKLLMNQ